MTTNATIKLAPFFTTENPRKVWILVDDAPEWLKDAVREAHQGDMPNDWIYSEIRDVCQAIDDGDLGLDDCGDPDHDKIHEYADGAVDIYTKGLYQWQADMCLTDTYSYAEEQLSEFGGEASTGEKRISALQYCAIEAIAVTVLNAWREALDDTEG